MRFGRPGDAWSTSEKGVFSAGPADIWLNKNRNNISPDFWCNNNLIVVNVQDYVLMIDKLTSPGPEKTDSAISPPVIILLIENLNLPLT